MFDKKSSEPQSKYTEEQVTTRAAWIKEYLLENDAFKKKKDGTYYHNTNFESIQTYVERIFGIWGDQSGPLLEKAKKGGLGSLEVTTDFIIGITKEQIDAFCKALAESPYTINEERLKRVHEYHSNRNKPSK